MPRLSIGLPVFNGAAYLRQAIESILSQTFSDFDLVVVDNCSSDDTPAICEEYARRDRRMTYHRNSHNLGIAPNFNRAYSLTTGEYFKWASHDDVLGPDFCRRCVEVLDHHPNVVLVYSRTIEIDGSGAAVGDYDPQPRIPYRHPSQRFGLLLTRPDGRAVQSMGVIRRSALERTSLHGSFPCSDEVLMAHLALLGEYHEIEDRLYFYRFHEGQSTKGPLASERARVLVFDSSRRGEVVKVKGEHLAASLQALRSAPISHLERLRSCLWLLRWMTRRDVYRSLAKDALLAFHERVPVLGGVYRRAREEAEVRHHYAD